MLFVFPEAICGGFNEEAKDGLYWSTLRILMRRQKMVYIGQPEPINVGVCLALVLVSKGVQGGHIHTRHLLSDFFPFLFCLFVTNTNKYKIQ